MFAKFKSTTTLSRNAGQQFAQEEDGSLTAFSLLLFICMVIIGGISIDIMVFENNRTRLQNLSDRAALAAADLDQDVPAVQVVNSYFEKEGLEAYLTGVVVNEDVNQRSVSISTSKTQRTMFLNFWNHTGINTLNPRAVSAATEARTDIEISLVLDVSNSMNWASTAPGSSSKLQDLKDASKRFIDKIYESDEPERITVSLVPYSTHVNAGQDLLDGLDTDIQHTDSFCLNFENSDYQETRIRGGGYYSQSVHFDQWFYHTTPQLFVCRPDAVNVILPFQSDPEDIKDYIDDMTAHGNTSTEIGMKWGTALLDPSARTLSSTMIGAGVVDGIHSDRPYDWDRANTQKYIVVLTDGVNTEQKVMNPAYASGDSSMWRWIPNPTVPVSFYSYESPELGDEDGDGIPNERFYNPAFTIPTNVSGLGYSISIRSGWSNSPLGLDLNDLNINYRNPTRVTNRRNALIGAIGGINQPPVELDYRTLWAEMPVRRFAWYYVRAMRNSNTEMNNFYNDAWVGIQGPLKDDRLLDMCEQAFDNGVTVYTIGFEVNDHAADIMGECASNENYFIRVVGNDLEAAFDSIANSISRLKLTQ